jgi:hypothetical protein
VTNVVDDRFKTMQLNISGVKAFSAHPTSISRYLAADFGLNLVADIGQAEDKCLTGL